jgi:endonuclease-3
VIRGAAARRARAARVAAILEATFPAPTIPLDHGDPFQLLVAVVLSAQTTDARVNQVTPALFAAAPTAAAMARLPAAAILGHIRTCGLAPTKAKNVRALAEVLVRDHGGDVPRDFAALEALPGVGHKTASVVMAQAFGVPAFPVDTHIHRLAARWGLSSGKDVITTERDLKAVFPAVQWNTLHLQIIYFGRQHCPARGHVIASCPICAWAMTARTAAAERRRGASR